MSAAQVNIPQMTSAPVSDLKKNHLIMADADTEALKTILCQLDISAQLE